MSCTAIFGVCQHWQRGEGVHQCQRDRAIDCQVDVWNQGMCLYGIHVEISVKKGQNKCGQRAWRAWEVYTGSGTDSIWIPQRSDASGSLYRRGWNLASTDQLAWKGRVYIACHSWEEGGIEGAWKSQQYFAEKGQEATE